MVVAPRNRWNLLSGSSTCSSFVEPQRKCRILSLLSPPFSWARHVPYPAPGKKNKRTFCSYEVLVSNGERR